MIDPFGISKAKPAVTALARQRVAGIEARKGRLVRVGHKKNLGKNPAQVSGKEFVQWVRANRLKV